MEQGQTGSYCSPEHGEQNPNRGDGVEARPWGTAGIGGLAMCHDVPHGPAQPQGGGLLCCTCMQQHVPVHLVGRLVDAGHAPAAVCSARAKMTVSVVW